MQQTEPEKRRTSWGEVVLITFAIISVLFGIYFFIFPCDMVVTHPGDGWRTKGIGEYLSKDAVRVYGAVGIILGVCFLWAMKHFSRYNK